MGRSVRARWGQGMGRAKEVDISQKAGHSHTYSLSPTPPRSRSTYVAMPLVATGPNVPAEAASHLKVRDGRWCLHV